MRVERDKEQKGKCPTIVERDIFDIEDQRNQDGEHNPQNAGHPPEGVSVNIPIEVIHLKELVTLQVEFSRQENERNARNQSGCRPEALARRVDESLHVQVSLIPVKRQHLEGDGHLRDHEVHVLLCPGLLKQSAGPLRETLIRNSPPGSRGQLVARSNAFSSSL